MASIQPHNVRFVIKMSRLLNLGRSQVMNYKKDVYNPNHSSMTYYLVQETLEVLSFREWYQLNRPSYIVSGSYNGCMSTKDRMLAKQQRFMTAQL